MAGTVTIQTMIDGPRHTVLNIIGNELTTFPFFIGVLVDPATFSPVNPAMSGSPPPTLFRVEKLEYSITDGSEVQLSWVATTGTIIYALAGRGKFEPYKYGGLQNPPGAGRTGQISLFVDAVGLGAPSTTCTCTFALHLVKWAPNV
jgi:hypothetical protein